MEVMGGQPRFAVQPASWEDALSAVHRADVGRAIWHCYVLPARNKQIIDPVRGKPQVENAVILGFFRGAIKLALPARC